MTEAVVDGLEVVDVQEQHDAGARGGAPSGQRNVEAVTEEGTVGQARQRVAERHRAQLVLQLLALGDVTDEAVVAL